MSSRPGASILMRLLLMSLMATLRPLSRSTPAYTVAKFPRPSISPTSYFPRSPAAPLSLCTGPVCTTVRVRLAALAPFAPATAPVTTLAPAVGFIDWDWDWAWAWAWTLD